MTRRERENLTEKCINRHHAAKEQKSRQQVGKEGLNHDLIKK